MILSVCAYGWVESGLLMLLLLCVFNKTFRPTPWSVVYALVGGPIWFIVLVYFIIKGK